VVIRQLRKSVNRSLSRKACVFGSARPSLIRGY